MRAGALSLVSVALLVLCSLCTPAATASLTRGLLQFQPRSFWQEATSPQTSPQPSPTPSPTPSPARSSPSPSPSPRSSPSPSPSPATSPSPSPSPRPVDAAQQPQALQPPEPGMLPLPYYRSWSYPPPAPTNLTHPWSITLPDGPLRWYYEPEAGVYRQPQNRHVFGPLATLPSVLLMQGTINLGLGTVLGTQGALYFHQKLYYNGGAEMGWVYYCRDQRLQSYFLADANLKNQSWFAHSAPNTDYVGQQLSYRMALNNRNRRTSATVYNSNTTLYTLNDNWPRNFQYDPTQPWYVTLTWQRAENGTAYGSLTNASLWYKP